MTWGNSEIFQVKRRESQEVGKSTKHHLWLLCVSMCSCVIQPRGKSLPHFVSWGRRGNRLQTPGSEQAWTRNIFSLAMVPSSSGISKHKGASPWPGPGGRDLQVCRRNLDPCISSGRRWSIEGEDESTVHTASLPLSTLRPCMLLLCTEMLAKSSFLS